MTAGAMGATATVTKAESRTPKVIRAPSFSLFALVQEVAGLWNYRDLLYTLSAHRVKIRYKQSMLGLLWAIAQPASLMLIYTVVFSIIARMPSENMPYAVFTYTALLPWIYFSSSLTGAVNGIVSNAQFVTKVYFPREILPISYVAAALFDFTVGSTLLVVLMFHYHVRLTSMALYVVPVLLVATIFALAVSLILSATQVRFRDFGIAIPLLLQLWMFASPVVYPLSAVPARLRSWYILNPIVGVVENFRRVVLQGQAMEWSSFLASASIACALLPISYTYFKHVEATMADII